MGSVKINVGGTWKETKILNPVTCSNCRASCLGECHGGCKNGCGALCYSDCDKHCKRLGASGNGSGWQYGTLTDTWYYESYTGRINIGGTSKQISTTKANIGGTWKTVK